MSKVLSGIVTAASTLLATGAPPPKPATLYDKAVAILRERYFDRIFVSINWMNWRSIIVPAPQTRRKSRCNAIASPDFFRTSRARISAFSRNRALIICSVN